MLKDCLEVFEKKLEQYGDSFILDSYILGEGTYVYITKDQEVKKILEITKKDMLTADRTDECYKLFVKLDYYSRLIDMNKPMDSKKQIHSNNYLSFFVKKETLQQNKLTNEIVNQYYDILKNPRAKYIKPKALHLYEQAELECGKVDEVYLETIKNWVITHIYTFLEDYEVLADKKYLKLFFEADEATYQKEGQKYIVPNIYNAVDYNVMLQEQIYGMPNNNLGLNSKKPYLRQKTRKNEVPYLIDTREVLLQKKFFDYLMNQVSEGKRDIYINEKEIKCLGQDEHLDLKEDSFSGVYLRIQKEKEVKIIDFDTIERYTDKLKDFRILPSLEIDEKYKANLDYGPVKELFKVAQMIDKVYFRGNLSRNYFTEAKDVKPPDLKEVIIRTRQAFFNWFYKGDQMAIKALLPKESLKFIKESIRQENLITAKEQWMLREALIQYFNQGGEYMSDIMNPLYEGLKEKVTGKKEAIIETDREYYCAVGQIANYLLSRSKSNKKVHAMINPILNTRDNKVLKEQLKRLFKKYNYDITSNNMKLNLLYAMVIGYETSGDKDEEALLYGYLQQNIVYMKGEK